MRKTIRERVVSRSIRGILTGALAVTVYSIDPLACACLLGVLIGIAAEVASEPESEKDEE